MGFNNSSCSFSRFRLLDSMTDDIFLRIPDKLKQFSFKEIDHLPEMQSFGWVSFEDMLDSEWNSAPPQKGAYIVFSLRIDTRRIPPNVIKKHTMLALREEKIKMEAKGQKFISRERKKEIKEQVTLKLRQHFLPVPAEFNVIWNIEKNEIWFASIQSKMIELFMEFFTNTFEMHLEQLTPYTMAQNILGDENSAQLDTIEETIFINDKEN